MIINVTDKEKAIEIVKKFNKENRYRDCGRINNAIDMLIYIAENSIPKEVVKELKGSITLDNTIVGGRRNSKTLEYGIKLGKIKACEELLKVKVSCSAVNIIENLQKENESKQKAYDDCYCEYKHYKQFESIPKQEVKDKIEEIEEKMKYEDNEKMLIYLHKQRKVLRELLKGEK